MGLSASQGRLLSLTSRMSDLERRSQTISNQKMRLTSTSADAAQKYQQALNMEKITFNNGYNTVVATAQNLTEYNPNITTQRFLNTADGKLVVNSTVAGALSGCNGNLDAFLNGMGLTTNKSIDNTSYSSMLTSSTTSLQNRISGNLEYSNAQTALSYFNSDNYDAFTELMNNTIGTDRAKQLAASTEILSSGLYGGGATEQALSKINFPEHNTIDYLVETGLLNEKSGKTITESCDLASHASSITSNLTTLANITKNGIDYRAGDSGQYIKAAMAGAEQAITDYKNDIADISKAFATYFGVSISEDEAKKNDLSYTVPDLSLENKGSLTGTDSDGNGIISESEYGSLSYQKDDLLTTEYMSATADSNSNSLYNQMVNAMGIQNDEAKKKALADSLQKVLAAYLRQIPYDFKASDVNINNDVIKSLVVKQGIDIDLEETMEKIQHEKYGHTWHHYEDVMDGSCGVSNEIKSDYQKLKAAGLDEDNEWNKYIVYADDDTTVKDSLALKTTYVSSETQNSGQVDYKDGIGINYDQYKTSQEYYINKDATEEALAQYLLSHTTWTVAANSKADMTSDKKHDNVDHTDYRDAQWATEADDLRLHVNTYKDNGFSISTTQALKQALYHYENSVYGISACTVNSDENGNPTSITRGNGSNLKSQISEVVKSYFKDATNGGSVNNQVKSYIEQLESLGQYMKPEAKSVVDTALAGLKGISDYDSNLKATMDIVKTVAAVSGPENFTKDLHVSYDAGKVTYYTNIFNEVMSNGGIPDGYAQVGSEHLGSAEWLNTNLSNGNIYISSKEDTSNTNEISSRLNYKSDDMCINVEADESYIAKAEAEYDAAMNEINTKEKRLDMELEQNSTEYNAVQQEIEAVKKVMQKNVDRTFKLFG